MDVIQNISNVKAAISFHNKRTTKCGFPPLSTFPEEEQISIIIDYTTINNLQVNHKYKYKHLNLDNIEFQCRRLSFDLHNMRYKLFCEKHRNYSQIQAKHVQRDLGST